MTKLKYTLILLLFVLNINAQWIPLNGPFNNKASSDSRVMAIDEKHVFVAVFNNNGVFKTADNGKHWQEFNTGLPQNVSGGLAIQTMAIVGDTIFICTSEGVYRSNVNTCNWEALNAPFDLNYFSKMCSNGNQIFVATRKGLYVSSDNGTSWTLDKTIGEVVIWALHYENGILYHYRDGIFSKSLNNGQSWTDIPVVGLHRFRNILISNGNLFAAVENGLNGNYIGGVYKSVDGGLNWKLTGKDNFPINTMIKSGNNIYALGLHTMMVTPDDGATWKDLNANYNFFYATYGCSYKNRIVLGDYYSNGSVPIHFSSDAGNNWSWINNNIIGFDIESVDIIDNKIIADVFSSYYMYSNDNGNDWNATANFNNYKSNGKELLTLNSNYNETTGVQTNKLLKSTDGINWTEMIDIVLPKQCISTDYCVRGAHKLIKYYKNEIYIGVSFYYSKSDQGVNINKVFKSTDNGLTWNMVMDKETDEEIMDIAKGTRISCALGKYGGVYISNDNGVTWFNPRVSNITSSVRCIAVDSNDHLYLGNGIWGNNPRGDGIFRSTDGGLTWGLITNGLQPILTKNIQSYENNLFAFTTNYNNSIGAVFLYDYINNKWKEISSTELNNAVPRSFTFHNDKVYCATESNGIWVNSLSTLGTENNIIKETGTIKIAPNPTDSYVLVDLGKDEDFRNFAYEVFNLLGQKMVEGNFTENTTSIPLHHFLNENGIYFMKIINKTNNSFITRKVIFNNMK